MSNYLTETRTRFEELSQQLLREFDKQERTPERARASKVRARKLFRQISRLYAEVYRDASKDRDEDESETTSEE